MRDTRAKKKETRKTSWLPSKRDLIFLGIGAASVALWKYSENRTLRKVIKTLSNDNDKLSWWLGKQAAEFRIKKGRG